LSICIWPVCAVSSDTDAARDQRIAALIGELGNNEFQRRQSASKEFVNLGEPALLLVEKAAEIEADLEIGWRAREVIQAVRERVTQQA
jgi:hypothetical protein